MKHNELITKRPVAAIGEEIDHELGAQMVKDYHEANPQDTPCYTIGREILEKILAQPDCSGIRFYNAYNEVGEKTLVYLGLDNAGKPLLEYTVATENGDLESSKAIVADRAGTGGKDWWEYFIFW